MEDDPGFRKHKEQLRRLLRKAESLLGETDDALNTMSGAVPTAASIARLDRLRGQLAASLEDYLRQDAALLDYTRGQLRKIEEANRRTNMAERRSQPTRNDARILEVSEELTTKLRLERVDGAIKELLDFLSDTDFFAANASQGRRRRLKTLGNALEKALQK